MVALTAASPWRNPPASYRGIDVAQPAGAFVPRPRTSWCTRPDVDVQTECCRVCDVPLYRTKTGWQHETRALPHERTGAVPRSAGAAAMRRAPGDAFALVLAAKMYQLLELRAQRVRLERGSLEYEKTSTAEDRCAAELRRLNRDGS